MATVKTHQVEPTPPPKTYDILGLTEDEMELLVNLLGNTCGGMSYGLYNKLPFGMYKADYFGPNLAILRPKNGK